MLGDIPEAGMSVDLGPGVTMATHRAAGSKKSRRSAEPAPGMEGEPQSMQASGATMYTLTWTKVKYKTEFKPDGRKCTFCNHRDCDHDPVSKEKGIIEIMWWGCRPHDDGTTSGNECGFCMRIYFARIKTRGITLSAYRLELGQSESKLNAHQTLVSITIKAYKEKGRKGENRILSGLGGCGQFKF